MFWHLKTIFYFSGQCLLILLCVTSRILDIIMFSSPGQWTMVEMPAPGISLSIFHIFLLKLLDTFKQYLASIFPKVFWQKMLFFYIFTPIKVWGGIKSPCLVICLSVCLSSYLLMCLVRATPSKQQEDARES